MLVARGLQVTQKQTVWSLADLATTYLDVGGPTVTYRVNVIFRTDATVDVIRTVGSDLNNEQDPYVDPPAEAANTWVRCTFNSGDDMTGGDTRGVWHRCDVQREFELQQTSGAGPPELQGNFDFELSSDPSGSPIVALALSRTISAGELF